MSHDLLHGYTSDIKIISILHGYYSISPNPVSENWCDINDVWPSKTGGLFPQRCFHSSWKCNTWNVKLHHDWPETGAVHYKGRGLLLLLSFQSFCGWKKKTCCGPWFVLKVVRVQTAFVPEEGVVFHTTLPEVFTWHLTGSFEEEWCLIALQKKKRPLENITTIQNYCLPEYRKWLCWSA